MYKKVIKRILDIIIGLIAFPFFLLSLIIVGPIIYFTDKGPIFYNASRIGKNEKLFKMFKYRSMYVNSPDIRLEDGSTFNSADDPRVTPIGRFIRKTSIDEIPQILNIINGTMSLVGPRPNTPEDLHRYLEEEKYFLSVRPGITGLSQAYYRNQVDSKTKATNDMVYAKEVSFSLDMRIIFKTIRSVLKQENVYRK